MGGRKYATNLSAFITEERRNPALAPPSLNRWKSDQTHLSLRTVKRPMRTYCDDQLDNADECSTVDEDEELDSGVWDTNQLVPSGAFTLSLSITTRGDGSKHVDTNFSTKWKLNQPDPCYKIKELYSDLYFNDVCVLREDESHMKLYHYKRKAKSRTRICFSAKQRIMKKVLRKRNRNIDSKIHYSVLQSSKYRKRHKRTQRAVAVHPKGLLVQFQRLKAPSSGKRKGDLKENQCIRYIEPTNYHSGYVNSYRISNGVSSQNKTNSSSIRRPPKEIRATPVTICQDDSELTRRIQQMLEREITPEDYEILLQLDNYVKPKTLHHFDVDKLECGRVYNGNFYTNALDYPVTNCIVGDCCMICMEDYGEEESALEMTTSVVPVGDAFDNTFSLDTLFCDGEEETESAEMHENKSGEGLDSSSESNTVGEEKGVEISSKADDTLIIPCATNVSDEEGKDGFIVVNTTEKTTSKLEVSSNSPTQVLDLQNNELTTALHCIMDDMKSTLASKLVTRLPCGHVFHKDCISKWLTGSSTKCPIDNLPVFDT